MGLRVRAGSTSMPFFVSSLAPHSHLQLVEINGGSWQLWLCVEQMAEEWLFLLQRNTPRHTNGSVLTGAPVI